VEWQPWGKVSNRWAIDRVVSYLANSILEEVFLTAELLHLWNVIVNMKNIRSVINVYGRLIFDVLVVLRTASLSVFFLRLHERQIILIPGSYWMPLAKNLLYKEYFPMLIEEIDTKKVTQQCHISAPNRLNAKQLRNKRMAGKPNLWEPALRMRAKAKSLPLVLGACQARRSRSWATG